MIFGIIGIHFLSERKWNNFGTNFGIYEYVASMQIQTCIALSIYVGFFLIKISMQLSIVYKNGKIDSCLYDIFARVMYNINRIKNQV